jgi:hypothetical protein
MKLKKPTYSKGKKLQRMFKARKRGPFREIRKHKRGIGANDSIRVGVFQWFQFRLLRMHTLRTEGFYAYSVGVEFLCCDKHRIAKLPQNSYGSREMWPRTRMTC